MLLHLKQKHTFIGYTENEESLPPDQLLPDTERANACSTFSEGRGFCMALIILLYTYISLFL